MDTADIAGIVGSILGILGGVVGTYFSIRNTNGPCERRFVIRGAIGVWLVFGLIAAVVFFVPQLRPWALVPIGALVVVGVPLWNRRQEMIRRAEARK